MVSGDDGKAADAALIDGDADDLLWRDVQAAPGTTAAARAAAPTTPTVSPGSDAAFQSEVSYVGGVSATGAAAATSFWTVNDGTAHKWQKDASAAATATAGTGGGTVLYYFDPSARWSASEIKSFTGGFALWAAEADIHFAPTTDASAADVVIARGSDGSAHAAVAQTSPTGAGAIARDLPADGTGSGTDISIDTSAASFSQLDSFTTIGGYGITTVIHEEGHLLGLGHGGDYNGTVSPAQQQNGVYDSRLWSVMSYIQPDDTGAADYASYPVSGTEWGATSDFYGRAPYTPMTLDILAAQRLYGAPTSTPLSGGQVFGFNTNVDPSIRDYFDFTVDKDPVVTLFDMGTGNTLDLSGYATAATIDLRAGHFSSFDDMTNNLGIAFGTAIDDVVGTTGRDIIVGNADANVFTGNASGDTFTGGGGADVFRDTAADLAGSTVTDFAAADTIDVTDAAGAVADLAFSAGVLSFMAGATSVTMVLQGLSGGAFAAHADTTGGGGVDIVYDPTAPVAPAAPTVALAPGSDTGASSSDGVTAATAVTLTGAAAPGDAVAVFDDVDRDGIQDHGEATLGTATAAAGTGLYAMTVALAPGVHSLRAVAADHTTGVSSSASVAASVTVDTVAPTTSPAALTVAENAGPVAIRIPAPTDDTTPAARLVVTIGALPTDGTVMLADGPPVTARETLTAAQLAALLFAPTPYMAGQTSTFTYAVTDLAGNVGTGAATLSIAPKPTTYVGPQTVGPTTTAPLPTVPVQTPSPLPATPVDAVSISANLLVADGGGFVLSGRASSTAGVAGVELSGLDADGQRDDLGPAALGAGGTFTATLRPDGSGALPGSIVAVLTDRAGGTATAAAPFDLAATGGPNVVARQDAFDPSDGSPLSTTLFKRDGSRVVQVLAGGQTLQSTSSDTFRNGGQPDTTFVFQPGHAIDVVAGFRLGGADHDTLSLPSSDYESVAQVLRDVRTVSGGVAIVDRAAGDAVRLVGITKTQLMQHRADIALHG